MELSTVRSTVGRYKDGTGSPLHPVAASPCSRVEGSGSGTQDADPSAFWGAPAMRDGPCLRLGREAVMFPIVSGALSF